MLLISFSPCLKHVGESVHARECVLEVPDVTVSLSVNCLLK